MLVEAARLRVVHDVVLQQYARAALVRVQAPPAVAVRVDVVHQVVALRRPRRDAERVDAAHVAQHARAEVVDVVVLDGVVVGGGGVVSPAPTHGDARVVEVADIIVRHAVEAAFPDPHPDARREHLPAIVDEVVVNHVAQRGVRLLRGSARLADAHAACPQVVDVAVEDPIVLTAALQPHAVLARVRDLAALDAAVARTAGEHGRSEENGCLAVGGALVLDEPIGVLKR